MSALGKPSQGSLPAVHENHVQELGVSTLRHGLETFELAHPADELGDQDVRAGQQMLVRHRESIAPGEGELLAGASPTADEAGHLVDVEVEHATVVVDVPPGERRLADAGGTVQQDEPGHATSL